MKRITLNQIPDEILNDQRLKDAMNVLPKNYSFEIPKTIWKIKTNNSKRGKHKQFHSFFSITFIEMSYLKSGLTNARRSFALCVYNC